MLNGSSAKIQDIHELRRSDSRGGVKKMCFEMLEDRGVSVLDKEVHMMAGIIKDSQLAAIKTRGVPVVVKYGGINR